MTKIQTCACCVYRYHQLLCVLLSRPCDERQGTGPHTLDAAACRLDPTLHGHSLRCSVVRCDKHSVFVACYPQQWHPNGCCKNDASTLVSGNIIFQVPLPKSFEILPIVIHSNWIVHSVCASHSVTWPRLFEGWITLFTGYIVIQRISVNKANHKTK